MAVSFRKGDNMLDDIIFIGLIFGALIFALSLADRATDVSKHRVISFTDSQSPASSILSKPHQRAIYLCLYFMVVGLIALLIIAKYIML